MRFVAAPSLRDTYAELRRQWWGTSDSLHIDCWADITHADGHDVVLRLEPFAGLQRLYYVNLGGYVPTEFAEQHKNVFVVAENVSQAKRRAKLAVDAWDQPHRDDIYDAEQAFCLNDTADGHRLYIHLTPAAAAEPLAFTCRYTRLGKAVQLSQSSG